MEMLKRKKKKEDGRYIIYYDFKEDDLEIEAKKEVNKKNDQSLGNTEKTR